MAEPFDTYFKYYEKAIEGRNFHYQTYNEWVNLYSIFTGAIFIAYYTVLDKTNFLAKILLLVLPAIGFITSLCWLKSVQGFYEWIKSWIGVVQEYEEKLNQMQNQKLYVYKVYMNKKKSYSTQKITIIFISCLVFSWIGVFLFSLGYIMKAYLPDCFKGRSAKIMMLICLVALILCGVVAVWFFLKNAKSNTKEMYSSITG